MTMTKAFEMTGKQWMDFIAENETEAEYAGMVQTVREHLDAYRATIARIYGSAEALDDAVARKSHTITLTMEA